MDLLKFYNPAFYVFLVDLFRWFDWNVLICQNCLSECQQSQGVRGWFSRHSFGFCTNVRASVPFMVLLLFLRLFLIIASFQGECECFYLFFPPISQRDYYSLIKCLWRRHWEFRTFGPYLPRTMRSGSRCCDLAKGRVIPQQRKTEVVRTKGKEAMERRLPER